MYTACTTTQPLVAKQKQPFFTNVPVKKVDYQFTKQRNTFGKVNKLSMNINTISKNPVSLCI